MKYGISESKGKFAYLQIYEQIKKDIVNGSLKFGSKLPSKRLLCEETGVSVITVEHAYSILSIFCYKLYHHNNLLSVLILINILLLRFRFL